MSRYDLAFWIGCAIVVALAGVSITQPNPEDAQAAWLCALVAGIFTIALYSVSDNGKRP